MGNKILKHKVDDLKLLNTLKDFINIDYKGFGCLMFLWEGTEIKILYEHWKYSDIMKAPQVYLGGVWKRKNKTELYYIWLNTKSKN